MPLADFQLVDVVSQHRIQPSGSRQIADDQLSHVGNIEYPDVISDGVMFFQDARVSHRHQPSAKRNNFRADPHMLLVKRRLFLGGLAHALKLNVAFTQSKVDQPVPCSMSKLGGEAAFSLASPAERPIHLEARARSFTVRSNDLVG